MNETYHKEKTDDTKHLLKINVNKLTQYYLSKQETSKSREGQRQGNE